MTDSNDKPRRVQLRRTRGWRMPKGTVKVSRPSEWGNPFIVGLDGNAAECVRKFREWMPLHWRTKAPRMLAGKHLACWCKLDQPCHADVLLEVANG